MLARWIGFASLAALLAPFHIPPSPAAAGQLHVFVSVLPQKYLAERIGGAHAKVDVMVGPGRSPATYEPTPRQMAALSGARLYFRIGVPFEEVWIDRLAAANPGMTVVDTSEMTETGGREEHDRHGPHSGHDPHIWTSPLLARKIARGMKDAFFVADPDRRSEYEENYGRLSADLAQLDTDIREIFEMVKHRKFMVFHPSWGYFADTYGLEQIPIEKDGREPGARQLAGLIETASSEGIRVIFVQEQFSRRNAEAVARAVGARVVAVDPLAEDYIANLRSVAALFAEAMK